MNDDTLHDADYRRSITAPMREQDDGDPCVPMIGFNVLGRKVIMLDYLEDEDDE